MKRLIALAMACLLTSGCMAATVGVVAYKMAQNRTQNEYREYVADTRAENVRRADRNQAEVPVMGFEEWKAAGR